MIKLSHTKYIKGVEWTKNNIKIFLNEEKRNLVKNIRDSFEDPLLKRKPQLRPGAYCLLIFLITFMTFVFTGKPLLLFISIFFIFIKERFVDKFARGLFFADYYRYEKEERERKK